MKVQSLVAAVAALSNDLALHLGPRISKDGSERWAAREGRSKADSAVAPTAPTPVSPPPQSPDPVPVAPSTPPREPRYDDPTDKDRRAAKNDLKSVGELGSKSRKFVSGEAEFGASDRFEKAVFQELEGRGFTKKESVKGSGWRETTFSNASGSTMKVRKASYGAIPYEQLRGAKSYTKVTIQKD